MVTIVVTFVYVLPNVSIGKHMLEGRNVSIACHETVADSHVDGELEVGFLDLVNKVFQYSALVVDTLRLKCHGSFQDLDLPNIHLHLPLAVHAKVPQARVKGEIEKLVNDYLRETGGDLAVDLLGGRSSNNPMEWNTSICSSNVNSWEGYYNKKRAIDSGVEIAESLIGGLVESAGLQIDGELRRLELGTDSPRRLLFDGTLSRFLRQTKARLYQQAGVSEDPELLYGLSFRTVFSWSDLFKFTDPQEFAEETEMSPELFLQYSGVEGVELRELTDIDETFLEERGLELKRAIDAAISRGADFITASITGGTGRAAFDLDIDKILTGYICKREESPEYELELDIDLEVSLHSLVSEGCLRRLAKDLYQRAGVYENYKTGVLSGQNIGVVVDSLPPVQQGKKQHMGSAFHGLPALPDSYPLPTQTGVFDLMFSILDEVSQNTGLDPTQCRGAYLRGLFYYLGYVQRQGGDSECLGDLNHLRHYVLSQALAVGIDQQAFDSVVNAKCTELYQQERDGFLVKDAEAMLKQVELTIRHT